MQLPSVSRWQDWHRMRLPDLQQLNWIESYLDLVLLALIAITDLKTEALLQAAEELDLKVINDRLSRWQQSKPNKRKPIEVAEARSLVLIICHLAKQHQESLRRAVSLLERVEREHRDVCEVTLLNNYIDRFITLYCRKNATPGTNVDLSTLAWKLLTDLLFYSGDNGHRLLWLAMVDAADS
ncbi:DUF3038 domain-containing protein [Myxosarcina sp. GI1]|uniref:DUF3038 domain-containing protein n=1 Tax=Myxosarcina sp. GI1 TaxID=1541065 RepID=UPI000562DDD2|nr:DUF3038 domain-containing protein [Myxosarcina sp. GI1]